LASAKTVLSAFVEEAKRSFEMTDEERKLSRLRGERSFMLELAAKFCTRLRHINVQRSIPDSVLLNLIQRNNKTLQRLRLCDVAALDATAAMPLLKECKALQRFDHLYFTRADTTLKEASRLVLDTLQPQHLPALTELRVCVAQQNDLLSISYQAFETLIARRKSWCVGFIWSNCALYLYVRGF